MEVEKPIENGKTIENGKSLENGKTIENGNTMETEQKMEVGNKREVDRIIEVERKIEYSTSYIIQSYFNAFNHIMNGSVACFMTLYLFREGRDAFAWHAYLTTIGYQLLMAEAIMVYYSPNSWSYFLTHKTKKHFHWILQVIAAMFIISGNVIIMVIRTTPHLTTIHAVTGLISMILLIMTMMQGVWAFFAFELRSIMKPMTSKFLHNMMSVLCYVIGMISLIYGYRYGDTHDMFETDDIEYSLIAFAILSTILSLIGAVKSKLRYFDKLLN